MDKVVSCAAAAAAVAFASVANAGIVGTNCSMSFYTSGGATYRDQSFIVSNLLAEFYYSQNLGGVSGYGAFMADVRAASLTVTLDFGEVPGIFFGADTRLALTIPETMVFDSFSLGSVTDVTGLDLADVSGAGTRTLLLDTSFISTSTPGASFTINFTTSAVPGPSALVFLSAWTAIPARRRRS